MRAPRAQRPRACPCPNAPLDDALQAAGLEHDQCALTASRLAAPSQLQSVDAQMRRNRRWSSKTASARAAEPIFGTSSASSPPRRAHALRAPAERRSRGRASSLVR